MLRQKQGCFCGVREKLKAISAFNFHLCSLWFHHSHRIKLGEWWDCQLGNLTAGVSLVEGEERDYPGFNGVYGIKRWWLTQERAKFLHDTIAAQRKFLAQQRSEAIRNRPPTKNQLRNQMMTYLKHVGNFKHAELKIKKFEEIQVLYEKIKRSDEDFISIGSAEDERKY
ncbi:hypothetical protein Tco_0359689 [Tanacetum coccineum]